MVFEAMSVQDETCGIRSSSSSSSNAVFASGNGMSLSVQLKDHFACANNDFSPKVRKPYTITKQRERWTEDEHRKFLEALKLYGRAWRKIEEHVGTKTAVQIRSHAQKFFFKVSRDPSGGNPNPEDPIEIPPPRPKRKPMHPYPRKIVQLPSKDMQDHSMRSLSPNLSHLELENHSPKSVLSVMGSEMVGSTGSDTPDGSSSPVSYASGFRDEILANPEPNLSSEESGSPSSSASASASVSIPLAKFPVKLELFTQENSYAKEISTEETSSRSLKLFGRTVLVTESPTPSQSHETSNPPPSDQYSEIRDGDSGNLPQAVQALYLMHFNNENSNLSGSSSPTPMPLWPFYGGLNFPAAQLNKPELLKGCLFSTLRKDQNAKVYHEDNRFVNVDVRLELDLLQCRTSLDHKAKEQALAFKLKPSSRSAFSQLRIRTDKNRRGFVPYKKSTAEEETRSPTINGDESEEKRTHLCL